MDKQSTQKAAREITGTDSSEHVIFIGGGLPPSLANFLRKGDNFAGLKFNPFEQLLLGLMTIVL